MPGDHARSYGVNRSFAEQRNTNPPRPPLKAGLAYVNRLRNHFGKSCRRRRRRRSTEERA